MFLAENADSKARLPVEEISRQAAGNMDPVCDSSLPISRRRGRPKLKLARSTSYLSFNEETIFSKIGTYTFACGRYHVKKMKYILLFFTV
jgi:hypothetical protein